MPELSENKPSDQSPVVSRRDLLPLAGLILIVFILYHPMFFGRPIMPDTWKRFEPWNSALRYDGPLDERIVNSNNDAILLYTPWNKFAHDELNEGRIPAWDPYCLSGVPLASNHLVPVFYPIYALTAWLAAPLFIMGISALLHTLLLGIFFYLFLKEWLGNRTAAWIGAVFLAVSLLPNPHYQPWLMTIAWFPAIWLLYERWLKHRNRLAGLWMALCWSVPLLAGYPSLFIQLSLFTAVWFLIRPAMMPINARPKLASRFGILLLPFVLALGLSAVQNVPTVIASQESDRTIFKSSEELAREATFTIPANQPWQMHAKRLLQPMLPFRFASNDFFNRGHVGLFPVMFALFGLGWIRRKEYPKVILWMALMVMPFALIPALNFLVYRLTGGIMIDPNPPVEVFGFLLLMLSAVGVKCWSELPATAESEKNIPLAGYYITGIAVLIAIAAAIKINKASFVPGFDVIVMAVTGLIVILITYFLCVKKKSYVNYCVILIGVVLALNAYGTGRSYYAHGQDESSPEPMPEVTIIKALKELTDPDFGGEWGRIIRFSNGPVNVMSLEKQPYTFYPNLGTYFGIPDAFGYHNLAPKSRFEYLRDIQDEMVIERRGIVAFTELTDDDISKLSGIGVRYILSDSPIPNREPVIESDAVYVYEILAGDPCLMGKVVEIGDPGQLHSLPVIIADEPGRMVVEVDKACVSIIYFKEAYATGWKASIDDESVDVEKTSLIMGVTVPEGEHVVEFRYTMPGLMAGWIITGIAGLIWILLCGFILLKSPSQKRKRL